MANGPTIEDVIERACLFRGREVTASAAVRWTHECSVPGSGKRREVLIITNPTGVSSAWVPRTGRDHLAPLFAPAHQPCNQEQHGQSGEQRDVRLRLPTKVASDDVGDGVRSRADADPNEADG